MASVAFPYLKYAFSVLSIPTVWNSSGGRLCLSPVLSSIPTGVGASAGHWRGSVIVVISKGSHELVTLTLCQTWLTDMERLSCPSSLVPWRREYVTSRRHSCCTTAVWPGHTFSAPQRKNWCALTHALLLYQRCGVGCAWRNTNANSHWLVLLTLEGNLALSEIPLVSHTDVESKFPPSGNEGYIGNRDVRVRGCCHIS